MPTHPKLGLVISPAANDRVSEFLARTGDPTALLVLMYGHGTRSSTDRWTVGSYHRANLTALLPEYEARGFPLLYECAGRVVAIPQHHLAASLADCELVVTESGFVVVPQQSGGNGI